MIINDSLQYSLQRTERQLKRVNIIHSNLRQVMGDGSPELFYAVALQLAAEVEKLTLLTRTLPAYTGHPHAQETVDQIMEQNIPVEMGYTEQGWFCLRIPLLLPKKEKGSSLYIRSFLYPAMNRFFRDKEPYRFGNCVLIFRHVYDALRPERQRRDHDNIEINMVSDTVALYVMTDDCPSLCCHYYCSAAAEHERTEVFVVPEEDFPLWLSMEKTMPKEGVRLKERNQKSNEKRVCE